jgi:hypothetical protein
LVTRGAPLVAQERPHAAKTEIVWAQEFLRALYPGLDGKKYTLTVETYLAYDQPGAPITWLRMDVGEGPKDWLKGYVSGCVNSVVEPPFHWPWPKELGPEPPAPPSLQPAVRQQSEAKLPEDCKSGPMYPKQFLTAGFQFDKEGRLTNFGTGGAFVNDSRADNEVYEFVHAHPQMTYPEIVATMKQHDTKYGPDDKEQFTKDLPLKQLEPFLGKLQIVSVGFHEMDKDPSPVPWTDRWLLSDWTVKAQATTKDGAKVPYEMSFSHLNGYLTGILDCRTSPWCNRN